MPGLSGIPGFDKLVHFTLYGGEAFFLYAAISWPGKAVFSLLRALAVTGAMAVGGAADELHQHWIPGRSMDGDDVAADVTGAAVGALLAAAMSRKTED